MARMAHKVLDGIKIVGFSLAGEEAVVAAPEYNVCFDVGRAPREIISVDNVCLTHGHMDHAAGIAYYFSQRHFLGNADGRLIVHHRLVEPIRQLMAVWAQIEGHPSPADIHGVDHLEDVAIRRGLLVRPFAVNHAPGALGYTLIETRHKLKPELAGKTGPQLVAMKKKGIAIEDLVEIPVVTYTGDTAVGRFLELDFVRHSRAVIVECTFFDPDHRDRARAGRHIHVVDLPQVLKAIPDAPILLTHLSRRTDIRLAKRILERVIGPSEMDRVTFLMDRPPRGAPQQPGERGSPRDAPTPGQTAAEAGL
jgi:ribonuclease Z